LSIIAVDSVFPLLARVDSAQVVAVHVLLRAKKLHLKADQG